MKRKIILSLMFLFILSALGVTFATVHVKNNTATLSNLIKLHQIADLRQHLIISIQTVQSDLHTLHTTRGHKLDLIATNVADLETTAQKCSGCHHTPDVTKKIEEVQSLILSYQKGLIHSITAPESSHLTKKLKLDTAAIGNVLLVKTEGMSIQASDKLKAMTSDAMRKIQQAWIILLITMLLIFLAGAIVAVNLTTSLTLPIHALVNATRMIASGELGHTVSLKDKTEFGELASHFNSMSIALKNGYAKLTKEISDHKNTEAALVKSEAFLNTIFDSIHDSFCIIDKSYRIVRVNEAYGKIKNVDLRGLSGEPCYTALHGRSSICDDCVVQKTFLSGSSCAKERVVLDPRGTKTWFEINTYPIFDNEGNILHVVEHSRDITERKKAEEALRESEERYALAARGANEGLWDWDLRNSSVYFSNCWKSMLGYEEKEVGNHPEDWLGRIHPDDRETVEAKIVSHLIGHNPHFESEYRILHKDGTYRWALNRGLAVRGNDGKAYRIAGSQTDITARKTVEEQLLHDALHDPLTGLPNRALFMDRLDHVLRSSQRYSGYLYAVLFLDMDRFKVINDSFGHAIGDKLLIAIGQKISNSLRPGDTVARLGGDEFAILLEHIGHLSDAVEIAERIRTELSSPFSLEGHEIFSGASIGIALSSGTYERPEQILRDADIAMYQAKAKGASSYEIFDAKMYVSVVKRLQLEADLRRAIEHKEFLLHYQPIIDLKKNLIIGFESLVRWNHPIRGLLYPTEFIPLAEETGLIFPLGDWTLRESCRQLRAWQEEYPQDPPLTMSMNISGRQFSQPDLINTLTGIANETGINANSLAIEITESIIMENVEAAAAIMAQLREIGIHIYIDDFGTGYSSLSNLHRFPITALKIDRTFVSKLTANGENKEIITTIVSLAKSLNLEVIVEGIELVHQLSRINNLNCHYGQGFLFSEPMEAEAMHARLEAKNLLPT
ncbi:MAG TPA: EAL domain-containing protein [Nitrospirota bacterium]|nr:EAL domain-containing protein [Nitrospirota bacterium]